MLIKNIYCNLSGGTAIGSLGTMTNISNIHYRDLYMNSADACYLKTNNGNGTVSNIIWEDVIVHGGPYTLTLNEAWGVDSGSTGVQLRNFTFKVRQNSLCKSNFCHFRCTLMNFALLELAWREFRKQSPNNSPRV